MCNNWPDYPINIQGATGGLIGNTAIICGGRDITYSWYYFDECYSLSSETTTLVTHMSVGRFYAASIVINDNTLWITGGTGDVGEYLKSTEKVTVTGTMPGPDLPMSLYKHAMVAINSTCSMVIGGGYSSGSSASTFFYDHNEGEWTSGPSLMHTRYWHAAGVVTDEVTDENVVAVTGGSYSGVGDLDSTEIMQDGEWVQGKISNSICYLLENFLVAKYSYIMS
jgi:hypothetical protein